MKARSGLAPLLSSAKAAGVVFGEDLDAAPDAGGLVVNRRGRLSGMEGCRKRFAGELIIRRSHEGP